MARSIYFDNSATTPVDPRVGEAMQPYQTACFGNPSSLHGPGRTAKAAVRQARERVAGLLNCAAEEIVFTASGTEADNLALIGLAQAIGPVGFHLITSAIEHPAILATCRFLEQTGVQVTCLPVSSEGIVEPASLAKALRPDTRLISIMAANNVVGTLQPIRELAQIARDAGAWFHTDAVQAAGKVPIDVRKSPVDMVSLSAHKLHGPKGVGALFVRDGVPLGPLMHGGGQERGLRSATENVPGIVGFGLAAEIARTELGDDASRLVVLRERIMETLAAELPQAYLIGHRYRRLPGHLCLGLAGQEGEAIRLLLALDEEGIAVSSGSACSSHHAGEPSGILLAMGFDPVRARGSLRITLGRFNTAEEVEQFLEIFPRVARNLRSMASRPVAAV